MKYRKIGIIVGVIFVILCAALYILIYTIPEITGALKKTTIVEYGEMRISEKLPAVVVREETVYSAQSSGNISYYVENNTKTRKGIKLLDIYGTETVPNYCPVTGIISYFCDGYETVLTPDTLADTDTLLPSGEDAEIKVSNVAKEKVTVGDQIYKIITHDTWYTVIFVPLEKLDQYSEGLSVTLEFEQGSVPATIKQVVAKENTGLVIASTSKYLADFDQIRQCEVELVLRDDKGLIVPNTAIGEEDGNPGVYVKKIDGDYSFTRIKVINTDGENSVVFADTFNVLREDGLSDIVGTISIYDEILKNASDKTK